VLRRAAISAILLCAALAASARTRPRYGGTVRVEIEGDAWTLDGLARRLVLDTLTVTGEAGQAQPALAVQWSAQNSDQRWEFRLRPGVNFQDGTPLTADAAAASLAASCGTGPSPNPSTGGPPANCPWNAVYVGGASDVVITTSTPMPDLPELLAQTRFAISRRGADGTIEGTGPFRVAGFPNGALTLTANDDCWRGRPFLDSVQILPHRGIRDQWLDLSVGRADVVQVPPQQLGEAQQQHFSMLVSPPVDLLVLTLAPQGAFADPAMRRAAALAVDREALCNVIFQKQGEIAASLLPQALSGYAFLFPVSRDLNGARALRGGASSPAATFSAPAGDGALQLAAERLALNLHEAGFSVSMAPAGAPSNLALRLVHLEAVTPRAALDQMLEALAQNVTVAGTDPVSLWRSESEALRNETVIPLLWLPRAWAVGPNVRGLRLSADGSPLLADASLEGPK